MDGFHRELHWMSDYIPYVHNTYFLVFAISSIIYLIAKCSTSRHRRTITRNAAAPEVPRRHRIPFLRGIFSFIMYNMILQLLLCLSFFALGSEHSAQRVLGAGAVALHLVSGTAFLLFYFALLCAMVLLGFLALLIKYSTVYVGSIMRECSMWQRTDALDPARVN
jgi:hypothetical protein